MSAVPLDRRTVAVYLLCCTSGLLSFAPSPLEPFSLIFLCASGFAFFVVLSRGVHLPGRRIAANCLLLFLVSCFFSFFTAAWHGTPVGLWARGLAPFLILAAFWVAAPLASLNTAIDYLNAIQAGCLIWAAKVCVLGWSVLPSVLAGSLGRLTYAVPSTLVPYGIIGLTITLFNPSDFAKRVRLPAAFLFGFLILACGYRSQIAIAAIVSFVWLLRRSVPLALMALVVCGLLASAAFHVMEDTAFFQSKIERFEDTLNEGVSSRRMLEAKFAFDAFSESPFVGKGLGYQVPVDAIETNHDLGWVEASSVGYLHNIWLYLLMDLGVVGVMLYAGMVFAPLLNGLRFWRSNQLGSSVRFCVAMVIFSTITFSSFQACFRSIQVNLVLGIMVAIASSSLPNKDRNFA